MGTQADIVIDATNMSVPDAEAVTQIQNVALTNTFSLWDVTVSADVTTIFGAGHIRRTVTVLFGLTYPATDQKAPIDGLVKATIMAHIPHHGVVETITVS